MAKALFLDRDGVVNREVGYLYRAEDVVFVEGIFSLCRAAAAAGYRLVVVTNQSGIARGMYTVAQFEELMDWMRARFRAEGVRLDAVYYCPYHPVHGVGEWKCESEDRKPGPGMLRRAAIDLGLELEQSLMVGDRCSDVGAGRAAGVRECFLVAGTEAAGCEGDYVAVSGLGEVEAWLRAG